MTAEISSARFPRQFALSARQLNVTDSITPHEASNVLRVIKYDYNDELLKNEK
jgi:hypothetical protein